MSEWQPIETAPRDGSLILGCDGDMVAAMWFAPDGTIYPWSMVCQGVRKAEANAWQDNVLGPTHWMPLPAPPTPARAEEQG